MAHRLLYHSTRGLGVIMKEKETIDQSALSSRNELSTDQISQPLTYHRYAELLVGSRHPVGSMF